MKYSFIFKIFTLAIFFVMFSIMSFAQTEEINSLAQIVVDKPMDNSYQLDLYFNNEFQDNAFLQKRGNGSFYVFIPDTQITKKNVKVIYRNKVDKADVKIDIEQQPYIKESGNSVYVRLSVETPINSDIKLAARTLDEEEIATSNNFFSAFTIISLILLAVIVAIIFLMYKKSNSFNSFARSIKKSSKRSKKIEQEKTQNKQTNPEIDNNVILPVTTDDFSCFDLPLEEKETIIPLTSAINKSVVTQPIENKIIPIKTIVSENKPIFVENESELDLPSLQTAQSPDETDESYRPELISELKLSSNKGFYLTTVGENDFALFGYVGEKIFFLQKFTDLTQINLQARFYDNKDDKDLYIVRLDSYKAMISVSDTEIKELATI